MTNNDNFVWNGLTWSRAQYLSPIGCNVSVTSSPDGEKANSVVYQNPGWSTSGLPLLPYTYPEEAEISISHVCATLFAHTCACANICCVQLIVKYA